MLSINFQIIHVYDFFCLEEYESGYRETIMRGGNDFLRCALSRRLEETPDMYIFLESWDQALSRKYHFAYAILTLDTQLRKIFRGYNQVTLTLSTEMIILDPILWIYSRCSIGRSSCERDFANQSMISIEQFMLCVTLSDVKYRGVSNQQHLIRAGLWLLGSWMAPCETHT